MTIRERIRKRVLGLLGLAQYDKMPDADRLTFINDNEEIEKIKLREYNIWYDGDGDELLNFYTRADWIEFNYEPFYMRNKKNYFWAINSKEAQIKRTHSGQPRNIVDTLVAITPFPMISAGTLSGVETKVSDNLRDILEESNIADKYKNEQMPLALVEGWGCWKINWDKDDSDFPVAVYYRAENVDFIYKNGNIRGVIFKDYYTNDQKKYMLLETRHLEMKDGERVLVIDKELYQVAQGNNDNITRLPLATVPELKDTLDYIEIGPFNHLFAVPVILFSNTSQQAGYGRSIFTGKLDLFDDLDQALSQAANTVRLSTPIEYFNSEFLERDKNGMPKRPVSYDRKYVMVEGQKNADGVSVGEPIQVTQPQINFQQYSDHAVQILLQIMNGIMSPATLGIDISKKDNAEAQREKEKVTIFTRNTIIESEIRILKSLCSQLLCAKEFMDTGKITVQKYDVTVEYNEFADDSFENKLEKLGNAYDVDNLSTKMFMKKLYGATLNRADWDEEFKWLTSHKEQADQSRNMGMAGLGGAGANAPGMMDMFGGGEEPGDEGIML